MSRGLSGLLWPTVMSGLALALMVSLGLWQVQRLHWKTGLLDQIAARATADPMTVSTALDIWNATEDVEYLRVRVNGIYDHSRERHLYQIGDTGPGWHVYTPLVRDDGSELWVNRGYVPLQQKDRSQRPESMVTDPVAVTGLARAPGERGLFTPQNDVATNTWYWRDLTGMAAGGTTPLPFFLEAEHGGDPGDLPTDGVTRLDLPNRHFGYALTWFGLAATLVLVYVPFVVGRLRQTAQPKENR